MLSLVALMPWWVGVSIAAVGYLVLHRMATLPQVTTLQSGQITGLMAQTMITVSMASAGLARDRRAWSMKQESRTPAYTTDWNDLVVARA